jgi:hypothetical protein
MTATGPTAGAVECSCIVADADGGSRFEIRELALTSIAPMAGLPEFNTSDEWPATGVVFMHIPDADSGTPMPWHPAPGPRLIICLYGTSQQETTDGDVRQFTAGQFFLTVDVTGRGHRSTNFGETGYAIVTFEQDPTS